MKATLEKTIEKYIQTHCQQSHIENVWLQPVVKFANANNPLFQKLKKLVTPNHYMPQDYLPNATTVISYFLPFVRRVGQSNAKREESSALWAQSYLQANDMTIKLNQYLVNMLQGQGVAACVPHDAGMISMEVPKSRWSQRHVAYIAGHGTFGFNNMLISDKVAWADIIPSSPI